MKNIVISMQNSLLSSAIARALSERGQFRCQQVAPGRMQEIASVCKTLAADVLLMEVNRFPAAMLEKRLETGAQVRTFYSIQNVAESDFSAGETYVSLMQRNVAALQEGLN